MYLRLPSNIVTLISDKAKTEVWQETKDVEKKSLQVLYSVQKTFDLCMDVNGPSVILANKMVAEAYARLQNRGVKVRFITEITKGNADHCKEMMKIAELNHLYGIKGSFVIADGTDYAGVANTEEAQPITQLIVSNVRRLEELTCNILDVSKIEPVAQAGDERIQSQRCDTECDRGL
jgi:hypothetical protein